MSANTIPNALATSSKELRMHATEPARHSAIARARRLACALATLAAVGVGAMGASATPALAGDCPNEQLRDENNSTRLPECRAYEMVTPLYKEGFPVNPQTFSDEGAVAYSSFGSFAGNTVGAILNEYVARRSSAGWTTTSPGPPSTMYERYGLNSVEALSPDLRSSMWIDRRGEAPADDGFFYYLRGPDGSLTRVGRGAIPGVTQEAPYTQEASADLTHVVFAHGSSGLGDPELAALYEYVGTGNEGPPLSVSVDNTGTSTPGEACPAGMSADGRVIAFNSGCNAGGALQLWARVGGSATVAVSHSECTRTSSDPGGACNALATAEFAGMATDGSRVYFTSAQQLVNGDTDQTNDLYECEIPPGAPAPVGAANPCASLTEVSHNASGADVQSVVNVSEDGSRVYFIAKGALAANLGSNDAAPVAGDENLYVWQKDAAHPAGQMTFIAKLEANDIGGAQSTVDGRYLIFTTASRLLTSDTDEAPDVYRYDADTHGLLRLSTDSSGTGGNEPGFGAGIPPSKSISAFPAQRARPTAMTSDASTVIFETAEALSPADSDGVTDVYEWHEGQVSLISNGGGSLTLRLGALGITRSGQDIFFSTGQPLTAGDSGTESDIYDARIEGGFPVTAPAPCSGEACQGSPPPQPQPQPQPPGISASAAFNGPGSPLTAEAPPATQPKPKPQTAAQKLAKALRTCKAKHSKKKRTACEKKARNTYRRGK
jgi:hypothetical protein